MVENNFADDPTVRGERGGGMGVVGEGEEVGEGWGGRATFLQAVRQTSFLPDCTKN